MSSIISTKAQAREYNEDLQSQIQLNKSYKQAISWRSRKLPYTKYTVSKSTEF